MRYIVLCLLAACSKQATCDSNEFICDTAAYKDRKDNKEEPPAPDPTDGTWIEIVRLPGCSGDPDLFSVSVRVHGKTNGESRVNIWQSDTAGGWNETHPLIDADPRPQYEELLAALRDEASSQQQKPGQSTSYTCGVTDIGHVLTYAIRVYDQNGAYSDCAVFTTENDPTVIAGIFDETLPEPNPVQNHEELNSDDCRVWSFPDQG